MYFIIATEKYTLNVYFSVTMIMEPVEWVSFVLIMFKVVVLAAFGAVDTQLIHISQKCISLIMYYIIATEKYTLNVYLSVTVIMEPVEWVSFVFSNVQSLGCICIWCG